MRPLMFVMTLIAVLSATLSPAAQNVVVVLDDSGSMDGYLGNTTKMEAAKTALYTVLEKLPQDAKAGIILLNNGWGNDNKWVVPLGKVDMQKVKTAISGVTANGGTPLGESMKAGADKLLETRDKEHYGTYSLLIVSDGEANDPGLVESYLPDIMARGITVDVIGVKMSGQHSLATKVHTYRTADDPESLTKAISEVFAESTGSGDSGQEDFELANAFQDNEIAAAVLKALSSTGNHPIGEKPLVTPLLDDQGNVQFDDNGEVVVDEGMSASSVVFIVIGTCIACAFLAVLFIAFIRSLCS